MKGGCLESWSSESTALLSRPGGGTLENKNSSCLTPLGRSGNEREWTGLHNNVIVWQKAKKKHFHVFKNNFLYIRIYSNMFEYIRIYSDIRSWEFYTDEYIRIFVR